MSGPSVRIGRYVLKRKLGTGGMAEVWLAEMGGPAGFQKQVVVKAILPHLASDPEFVRLFVQEARLAAGLNHPNVVQVFELIEEAGQYYSVMEWVDGGSVNTLRRAVGLPLAVVVRLLHDACLGLAYVHETAVHRDVSPDNILVTRSGIAKVADFGVARASSQTRHTQPGTVKGKLAYMPPEAYLGEQVDGRADVYALGLVAYELLTGAHPFKTRSDAETMHRVLHAPVEPPADLPEPLAAAVMRAISRQKDDRFADARAFARELEPFAGSHDEVARCVREALPAEPATRATIEPTAPATAPRSSTMLGRVAVAAAVALAVVGGGLFWFTRTPAPQAVPVALAPAEPVLAVPAAVEEPELPPAEPEPVAVDEPESPRAAPSAAATAKPPNRKARPRVTTGQLWINAYPWADVIVDGKPVGITPLAEALTVEAGAHQVTLVNGKLGVKRSYSVTVKPGRRAVLERDLTND